MTTTFLNTSRTSKYENIKRVQNYKRNPAAENIDLNNDSKELENSKVKLVKHKKCKVIQLVKEQIEKLKQRQDDFERECVEVNAKMWWDLQKNNIFKFLIVSSTLLFLWSTLVLLGAAICNLYNTDCTCYNNFWFLPWFARKNEYQLVF